MSWRDVEWTEYEITFDGLNEGVDPRLLPEGQLVVAENCDFTTKRGHIQKRPGSVLASSAPTGAGPPHKLVTHEARSQLLVADLTGTSTKTPKLYSYPDAVVDGSGSLDPIPVGEVSDVLVRRRPVAVDLRTDIISDMAFVKSNNAGYGFLVYGLAHMQTSDVAIQIVETRKDDGSYDPEHTLQLNYLTNRFESYGSVVQVRASSYDETHVLVTWGYQDGHIVGVVVDCSGTGAPTIGTEAILVSDMGTGQNRYHDTCGSTETVGGNPAWILGYAKYASGTPYHHTVRMLALTHSGGAISTAWGTDVTTPGDNNEVRAISVSEKSSRAWINWWDTGTISESTFSAAWHYAVLAVTSGAFVTTSTVWCDSSDVAADRVNADGWVSAIGICDDANEATMFHSQNYLRSGTGAAASPPYGMRDRPYTRYRRVVTDKSLGTLRSWGGTWILSKPWLTKTTGSYLMWCGINTNVDVGTTNTGGYDCTAVLMRFNDSSALFPASLVGTAAGLVLGRPAIIQDTTAFPATYWIDRGFQQGQSITYQNYNNPTTLGQIGYRTSFNVRYVVNEGKSGAWDVVAHNKKTAEFPAGYSRYEQAQFGGSVYMAGGVLSQWDGLEAVENGFVRAPNIAVESVTGSGTNWNVKWAEQKAFFQCVYETVLANGERVRSPTSNVVSVTFNGTAGSVAPDNTITLYADPPPATMRDIGPSVISGAKIQKQSPRVLAVFYCSDEPNSNTLHRFYEFDVSLWDNYVVQPGGDHISVTFDGGSVSGIDSPFSANQSLGAHEVIYNDSGELDNDLPYGGCSAIATHKDRLWIGGGEDPEVLWYSKERVDDRPAEFALGQQVRIPGVEVTALASVGDTLYAFCRSTVFAVLGDGPNATGDPSSGFFAVRPLSTTVGAAGQSCVTVFPGGALFYSGDDLYAIDAGGNIRRIGVNVEDSYSSVAYATSLVPKQRQVRIELGGAVAGETPSKAIVYDWDNNIWTTWAYGYRDNNDLLDGASIIDVKTVNGRTYRLADNGVLYREDPTVYADNDGYYRQKITSGWLSFGRTQGYKKLRRMGLLMQANPWADQSYTPPLYPHGLTVTTDYNWAESGFQAVRNFSPVQLGSILPQDGIANVSVYMTYQNQPSMRFTIDERGPSENVTGTSISSTYSTIGANSLQLTVSDWYGSSVTRTFTCTESAALAVETMIAEFNAGIASVGLDGLVYVYLDVSTNKVVIETIYGMDLRVEADTINAVLGISLTGQDAVKTVAAANQAGFILQTVAFEVGQIRGPQRLPAAQSR